MFQQTAELVEVNPEGGVVRPEGGITRPAVTFHTVLERPTAAGDRRADLKARRSGNWKNIFNLNHFNRSSQNEIR